MGTKEAQAAPAILAQVSAEPAPVAVPAAGAAAPATGVVEAKPAAPWVGL